MCTGGVVTIAVNETYLGRFKAGFKGVEWDPGHCSALTCMLAFCGNSHAKLPNLVIRGIDEEYFIEADGVLCAAGVSKLTFSRAEMTGNLGTVLFLEERANVTVRTSLISGNTGNGILYYVGGHASLTVLSTQFSMNKGLRSVTAYGSSTVVLDRVTIANNTLQGSFALVQADEDANVVNDGSIISSNYGAAVWSSASSTLFMHDSRMEHNVLSDDYHSAGLLADGDSRTTLKSVTVHNNTASLCAGIVAEGSAVVTVKGGSIISRNVGGGLCVGDNASMTMLEATLVADNRAGSGAGLWADGDSRTILNNVTVHNNTASNCAGIVAEESAVVTVKGGSSISGNDGGGLCIGGNASLTMAEGTLVANNTDDNAAGIWASGDSRTILNNVTVHNNTASSCAGIWAGKSAVVTVKGGSIISSNVNGSLCVGGNASLTMTEGTLVAGNIADSGAGLWATGDSRAILNNVTVHNNTASSCAGIRAVDSAVVNVKGGSNISSNVGGGLCAIENVTLNVTDAVWRNNSVDRSAGGGMLIVGNTTATITDSLFENNFAEAASGGGLRAGENAIITLQRCDFVNNTASNALGGGGLAVGERAKVHTEECAFTDNTAVYSSGGGMSVRDEAGVEVVGTTFRQNKAEIEGGAIYVLDRAIVSVTGGSEFIDNFANFTGDDIRAGADRNLVLEEANVNVSSPTVVWTRQACVPGESLIQGADGCRPCQMSTYSVIANSSICHPCPEGAVCQGGDMILPEANFWHSHGYSMEIHACPREKVCKLGGVCAEGYTGNVCGQCLPGYGSQSAFRCAKCMGVGKTVAAFLGAAVVMVLLIALVVHTTLMDTQQSTCSVRPSDLLRILVRHLQYLAVISTLRVQWPQTLNAIFGAVNYVFNVASSQVVSLDCVFSAESGPPLAIKRVLAYLLAPLGILGVVVFAWLLVRWVNLPERFRRHFTRQQQPAWDVLMVICLVVLFFFYPALVRVALSMFTCYKLDDPAKTDFPQFAAASARYGYWVYSMQQPCWEGWHLYWAGGLGVPCVVLFCFAVPVGMWWLLYRSRSKRALHGYASPLVFLHHNYKPKRWYWEVVSTVQIALLVAISVFSFTLGAYFTTVLLNVSLVAFWAMQLIYKPFASDELHLTSLLSLACLYATTAIASTLFTVSGISAPHVYGEIIGVIGLVMNALFVLGCCYRIAVHGSGVVAVWVRKLLACIGCGAARHASECQTSSSAPSEQNV